VGQRRGHADRTPGRLVRRRRPRAHWPFKEDLVADALQAGLPRLDEVADLGCVREDLLALCRQARDAMYSRPGFALRSVIHECDTLLTERFHGVIYEGVVESTIKLLREVITCGIER
jgi:hypothetical protein